MFNCIKPPIARVLLPIVLAIAGSGCHLSARAAQLNGQVICHGDSLTWGANASSGLGPPGQLIEQTPTASANERTTYPAVLARTLGPNWHVGSVGTGGWTIDLLKGEAPSKIDPVYNPNFRQNILIIFAGTNDLGGAHESAKTAFDKLVAYCRARHSAHPWRILVVTPPMAAYPGVYPPDFDAQMVQYDALIRRSWRYFADGIVDVQADCRFGAPGAEHNPQYFSSRDFTHLTDEGYAIVGHDAAFAVTHLPSRLQVKLSGKHQKQL